MMKPAAPTRSLPLFGGAFSFGSGARGALTSGASESSEVFSPDSSSLITAAIGSSAVATDGGTPGFGFGTGGEAPSAGRQSWPRTAMTATERRKPEAPPFGIMLPAFKSTSGSVGIGADRGRTTPVFLLCDPRHDVVNDCLTRRRSPFVLAAGSTRDYGRR